MAQLKWGKVGQLNFFDDHEYYQALGSLCRSEGYHITFETNSETESWGDAFRIKCLMQDSLLPDAFRIAKKNANRINCNDYVQHLYQHHHFTFDVANNLPQNRWYPAGCKVRNAKLPSQRNCSIQVGGSCEKRIKT